nr:vegetative cell wall protein gp1-like [Aegilops tauschii subsp. strangulata]
MNPRGHDGEERQGLELARPDSCAAGGGGADPDVGGEAVVAGDDEEGQSKNSSMTPGQKGDREVRERRRKKGGALRFRRGGSLLQQTTARPGGAAARCRGRRGGSGHSVMATEAERLGQGGAMQQERRSTAVGHGHPRRSPSRFIPAPVRPRRRAASPPDPSSRWPASSRGYAAPPFAVAISVSTPLGHATLLCGVGSAAVHPVAASAARLLRPSSSPSLRRRPRPPSRAARAASSPAARRLRPPPLRPLARGPVPAQAGPRHSALARANPSLRLAAPGLPRSARAGSARPRYGLACVAPSAPKPVRAALPSRA